jgi:CDP-diglyceride synthetase
MGRTKAVPGLSPNKTLEGLIGHILLAPSGLIIAILLAPMLGSWTSAWMPSRTREYWYVLLIFGWTIGAVGAIGDLVESVGIWEATADAVLALVDASFL